MLKKIFPLLVLSLAACGGGDVSDDQVAARRAAFDQPPIVVRFQGDSTEKGKNHEDINGATVAQTILDGMGRNIKLIGEGIGGSRAEQRLYGGETRKLHIPIYPWPQILASEPADFVAFKYSINDAKYYSAVTFRQHMEALIDLTEAAGMRVILQTPSPTDFPDPVIQAKIEHNVAMLQLIARDRPSVTLCNHWDYGLIHGYENLDNTVHPSIRAYQTWIGPKTADCVLLAVRRATTEARHE